MSTSIPPSSAGDDADASPLQEDGGGNEGDVADRALPSTIEAMVDSVAGDLSAEGLVGLRRMLAEQPALGRTMQDIERCIATLRDAALDEPTVSAVRTAVARFRLGERIRPSLFDRVGAVVAALVFDSREGQPLVGWRNESALADDVHSAFEADDVRIDIVAMPTDEATRWRIRGQLVAAHGEPTGVALLAAGENSSEPLVETIPDEGMFLLTAPAGAYTIVVELDDGERFVSAHLDLRPAGGR